LDAGFSLSPEEEVIIMSETKSDERGRRSFFRRLFALGGAVLGGGFLARKSGAQVRPVQRTTTLRLRGTAEPVEKYKAAFQAIKATGNYRTANIGWRNSLNTLSTKDKFAAVAVLEISQRHPNCKDCAGALAKFVTDIGGSSSFARPVQASWGLGCGGGCSSAKGLGCGVSCMRIQEPEYSFDQAGNLLDAGVMKNTPIRDFDAAFNNAAQSYNEIFNL
jgi:hypothetical protein